VAIILDADVIIRAERAAVSLRRLTASFPEDLFQVAAVTVAELWHGVERASATYRNAREEYVRRILGAVQILPYTENTALEHARIWAELESAGKMIGCYDLIVAATALEHGSAVATFNERHFTKIRGLKVIRPA
jgi:tRNA(fMet)-specific endonuclease VapC